MQKGHSGPHLLHVLVGNGVPVAIMILVMVGLSMVVGIGQEVVFSLAIGYLDFEKSNHFAYGYFSFCLFSCNKDILKNRINYFSVETSFCQFLNMASSGLR